MDADVGRDAAEPGAAREASAEAGRAAAGVAMGVKGWPLLGRADCGRRAAVAAAPRPRSRRASGGAYSRRASAMPDAAARRERRVARGERLARTAQLVGFTAPWVVLTARRKRRAAPRVYVYVCVWR